MTRGIEYVYVETHNWGKTVKGPAMQIDLRAASSEETPGSPARVVRPGHPTPWGSRLLELADPDERAVVLQVREPAQA